MTGDENHAEAAQEASGNCRSPGPRTADSCVVVASGGIFLVAAALAGMILAPEHGPATATALAMAIGAAVAGISALALRRDAARPDPH